MELNKKNTDNIDLNQLVDRLKYTDNIIAKVTRFVQILYWALFPFIVFLFIVNIIEKDFSQIFGGVYYITSFTILLWVFDKMYKANKNLNYSLPVVEILKKSADRYKLINNGKLTLVFYLGLLIMSIGITQNPLPGNISTFEFLIYFWGFLLLMFILGAIMWYFKHKPLRDKALQLIKEINDEI